MRTFFTACVAFALAAGCGDDSHMTPSPDAPALPDAAPDAGSPPSACDPSNIQTVPAGGMQYAGNLMMTHTLADQTSNCLTSGMTPPAGFGQDVYEISFGGANKHELVFATAQSVGIPNIVLLLRKDTCGGTQVDCSNISSPNETISQELDAGTYFLIVGLDNGSPAAQGGAYNLVIRDRELISDGGACNAASTTQACVRDLQCISGTCQRPMACNTLAADLTTTHSTSGDTTTGSNHFTELCDFTNTTNDLLYRVNVPSGSGTFDLVVHADPLQSSAAMTPLVTIRNGDCWLRANEQICSYGDQSGGIGVDLLNQTVTGDWYVIVDGMDHGAGNGTPTGAFSVDARMRLLLASGSVCDPADPNAACSGTGGCYKGAAANATCQAPTPALACADAVDITPMLVQAGGSRTAAVASFTRGRDPANFDFTGDVDSSGTGCQFEAGHPERVFKLTTTAAATIDLSTDDPSTEFDTALTVRQTDCMGGTIAGCNDDIAFMPASGLPNWKSHVTLTGAAAGTYFIFVQGSFGLPSQQFPDNNAVAGARAYGNFVLHASVTP